MFFKCPSVIRRSTPGIPLIFAGLMYGYMFVSVDWLLISTIHVPGVFVSLPSRPIVFLGISCSRIQHFRNNLLGGSSELVRARLLQPFQNLSIRTMLFSLIMFHIDSIHSIESIETIESIESI